MKNIRDYLKKHGSFLTILAVIAVGLSWLLLHRLGSLTGGLSATEQATANATYGWHGLYRQPFYLPLNIVRTLVFYLPGHHGQLLTRLPNVIFGAVTILSFGWLLKLWHGERTAILVTILFATSAWVLHVSRLASNDVVYLWTIPTLLLAHLALQRRTNRPAAFYGTMAIFGLLLYIPGVFWLVIMNAYWQRNSFITGWIWFKKGWQRALYVATGVIWLPLLIINLTRPGNFMRWLGFPAHLAAPATVLKQFVGVFVHIFLRGPAYSQLWLGRTPILDVFTLALTLLGIYFYAIHWGMGRSRLLGSFFLIGTVLVALGGPVGLSLLIPIVYIIAGTGIAYLLHDWLKIFPINPLARGLGIGLVSLAIALSGLYNLRSYFIAWPRDPTTQATFHYRR